MTDVRPAEEEAFTEVRHSMTRRTIARRLTVAKASVPHFYMRANCRVDALLELRQALNADAGERVSVNDLIVRAVALALADVPDANVQFDETLMRHFQSVDVAVAVATPRGLVTPILRDVPGKPVRQVATEVRDLAARAQGGKLRPEEYTGGHTTVSNLGMFGVEEFAAILNPPQSSIFAIGQAEPRLVEEGGNTIVATMTTVTVSFDHRAVDGAVGARLLGRFKELVESAQALVG